MIFISRKEAKANGLTHYFTGKPCKNGHADIRLCSDGSCRTCNRQKRRRLYRSSPEKSRAISNQWKRENRERNKEYMRQWRAQNQVHVDQYSRDYRAGNKSRRNAQKEQWRRENINSVREYARLRYKNNLPHKLSHIIRSMVNRVVTNHSSIGLFYKWPELKARMEMQFSEGMTWDNHGDWEIDHRIPVSKMLSRGVYDPNVINALSNLQPLWKRDNRAKNNRYSG